MKPEYLIHAEHLTVILCPLEKQHKILEHLKKDQSVQIRWQPSENR